MTEILYDYGSMFWRKADGSGEALVTPPDRLDEDNEEYQEDVSSGDSDFVPKEESTSSSSQRRPRTRSVSRQRRQAGRKSRVRRERTPALDSTQRPKFPKCRSGTDRVLGEGARVVEEVAEGCLLYTSPSPRD